MRDCHLPAQDHRDPLAWRSTWLGGRETGQYTSLAFVRRLAEAKIAGSMGRVGDALDNAVAESFFATLECELLDRHPWPTRQGLRTAVFDFIEVFYNRRRVRHEAPHDRTEVKDLRRRAVAAAGQKLRAA